MDIFEKNRALIDQRITEGLTLLQKHYQVRKRQADSQISSPQVSGRTHVAHCYEIEGVGNLLTMSCKETEENNLSSFVIMPYLKNLPLFSSDFVYTGENRFFYEIFFWKRTLQSIKKQLQKKSDTFIIHFGCAFVSYWPDRSVS